MQTISVHNHNFETHQVPTQTTSLLLIKNNNGMLACGYLNIETANKLGEVLVIVTGVKNFDDMLNAKVVKVSDAAKKLGIQIGETGEDALKYLI